MSNEPRGPRRRAVPTVDFLNPSGAPALYAPDSLAWQVFKNPISLFIGGITAVLLELAEERVRTGVWEHSIFPTDPLLRMQRTGLMTHVSVYAPVAVAEKLIRGVVAMHGRVEGTTPKGTPYRANDPELLNWVQCTVSYGFMEAYAAYCRPLSDAQRDHFYRGVDGVGAVVSGARSAAIVSGTTATIRTDAAASGGASDHSAVPGYRAETPALPLFLRPLQSTMVRRGFSCCPNG